MIFFSLRLSNKKATLGGCQFFKKKDDLILMVEKVTKYSKKIGDILDDLYPKTPVPLNHSSAYTLLVAVMLSAQTTDKKVNEVTYCIRAVFFKFKPKKSM